MTNLRAPHFTDEDAALAYAHRNAVLSLAERGGRVMSKHVDGTRAQHLLPIIKANIVAETHIMTDKAGQYAHLNKHFAAHDFVNHDTEQWRKGDAHTNTAESFYSVFKRGIVGVYHHCCEQHLHRNTAEFDFTLQPPLQSGHHRQRLFLVVARMHRRQAPDLSADRWNVAGLGH